MRRNRPTRFTSRLHDESGQSMILVLLALGIFLLASIGFGVDFANFWFHRQSAQVAADAACTAGVMDMLVNANTGSTRGGFTEGTDFDCSASTPNTSVPTSPAPCVYANLNGYDGANNSPGNQVAVSFPGSGSVPGIDPGAIPPSGLVPSPYLRVDVIDHVQAYFSALLTGSRTVDVHVRATCAVVKSSAPIPLIVLNPTCPDTFTIPGSGTVAIVGGPTTSIQVNSSNTSGTSVTGSGNVDLSGGGPLFTGSDMAVLGGPAAAPGGFNGGSTGNWRYPVSPIADPFAQTPAPPLPALSTTNATPISVTYPDAVYGCPDHSGCVVYLPGQYTNPIIVKNKTAVFVPGLYYFNIVAGSFAADNCGVPGGCIAKPTGQCNYAFDVDSNGVVRMATGTVTGDGSQGITFYLSGSGGAGGYGSVFFGSNAGKPGGRTIDSYDTTSSTTGVKCPGALPPDPKLALPASMDGNVLFGPCTQDGTYFTSPTNASTVGPVRGLLFFQDRANGDNHGQPSMQGGGGLLLAGTMYFHNCPNSTTTGCDPVADYKAFLQFQGTSGSGTFLLGNITTDELITGGTGAVRMQLDSNRVFTILKATMLQ